MEDEDEDFVAFVEEVEGADVCEYALFDGRVNVDSVLRGFAARSIAFKYERNGVSRWRELEARQEDRLSLKRFVPGSSHLVLVTRHCDCLVTSVAAASPVDALLGRYRAIAAKSRSRDTAMQKAEYNLEDPGKTFDIVGRSATYEVLLKGAGQMYATFCSPCPDEAVYRIDSFFLAMVAFPGAGKTTLGKRGWPCLLESWKEMPEQRKAELMNGKYVAFNDLVEESIKFNLSMYQDVAEASKYGLVVYREEGLSEAQVLGLRSLYMIIYDHKENRTSYTDFLGDLDADFPGLKHKISFGVAMEFITRLLELKKRVLATFFFDSVEGCATWFQELMSQYVHEHFLLADTKTSLVFPLFCIATTRFSQSLAREEGEPSPMQLTAAAKWMIEMSGACRAASRRE